MKPAFQLANATTLTSTKPRIFPSISYQIWILRNFIYLQELSIGRGNRGNCIVLFDFPCKHFSNLQILSKRNQSNFLHFNHSFLFNKHVICHDWFGQPSRHFSRSPIWFDWLWHFLLWWQHLPKHNNGHPSLDQLWTSKSHHKRCNRQIQFKSLHSIVSINCWLDWFLDSNVHRFGRFQTYPNASKAKLDRNHKCLHSCKSCFPWFSWTHFHHFPTGHSWRYYHSKLFVRNFSNCYKFQWYCFILIKL